METLSNRTIHEITRKLVEEFNPEQIILFGSHAWGTPHADSDVDLLVIVSNSTERIAKRAQRAYRALRGLDVPTDILVKTREEVEMLQPAKASLERQVLEHGQVLYG